MRLLPLLALAFAALPAAANAQAATGEQAQPNSFTTRSWMVGAGRTNRLETYLSPLEYTGPEFRLAHESIRTTRWLKGRVSVQQMAEGDFSYTKTPTDDGKYLSFDAQWHIAWHYNWTVGQNLRLMAGAGAGIAGGVVYNSRNGNNPAQAKLGVELTASAAAIYRFRIGKRRLAAREQISLPFFGLMFSPNYGQSYYEIFSLGHSDHNVCATWPVNAPTVSNLLTLDIPVGHGTLRTGYRMEIRQSHVNHLKSHQWSHVFLIGYVKHFMLVKNRKSIDKNFIY